MNKRGMLLVSETLKIIIAVLCIGLLAYLLFMMYYGGESQAEKEDATNLTARIEGIVLSLGEGNSSQVNGLTPADWIIISYAGAEQRPNQCAGTTCVCVCDNVVDLLDRQLKECQDNGICFAVKNLLPNPVIEIKDGGATDIEIYRKGGRLGIKEI